MGTLKHSVVVFLACAPLALFGASRVEVPTSIQVVDAEGRTHISTSTPSVPKETPQSAWVIPDSCATLFALGESANTVLPIPPSHPLWTRVESQRAVLTSLVSGLSFAPHLAQEKEIRLKRALVSLGNIPSEKASTSIACVLDLNKRLLDSGVRSQSENIERIATTVAGIQYGLQAVADGALQNPKSAVEALYAGDVLLSSQSRITSITIEDGGGEARVALPVTIFGRWRIDVGLRIRSDEKNVSITSPWWLFVGTHGLSEMKNALTAIPEQTRTIEGIFLRMKDITRIVST